MFRISGQVKSGRVEADGTIVLEGTVTETDFRHGDGVILRVDDLFVIKIGGSYGSDSFLLQWCLLPEWLVDVPGVRCISIRAYLSGLYAPAWRPLRRAVTSG